jgi:hypothetical protein
MLQELQEYLAHKKQPPPSTLQWDYAQDPLVVLGGGAVSYERGTPVCIPVSLGFRVESPRWMGSGDEFWFCEGWRLTGCPLSSEYGHMRVVNMVLSV